MSNKLLNIGAIIFFGLISLGLIISGFSSGDYKTSNAEVMQVTMQDDFIVEYAELNDMLTNHDSDIQFIDLRKAESFAMGHIPGAINIPKEQICTKKLRKPLHDERLKLVYSDQENEAVYAAMFLLGKGYSNIRVIAGSYEMIESHVLKGGFDPSYSHYRDDKARFDYPRFMGTGTEGQNTESGTKSPVVPQVQTEVITVQGGC